MMEDLEFMKNLAIKAYEGSSKNPVKKAEEDLEYFSEMLGKDLEEIRRIAGEVDETVYAYGFYWLLKSYWRASERNRWEYIVGEGNVDIRDRQQAARDIIDIYEKLMAYRRRKLNLLKRKAVKEWRFEGFRVVHDGPDQRLRVFFPGVPSDEVRVRLKANGFRWAPSKRAWQSYINPNAMRFIEKTLGIELK